MIVAITFSALLIVFWIVTIKYRKTLKKSLDSKEHPLKNFYGMGMFICDKSINRLVKKNVKVNRAIDRLVVKENTETERYLYAVKKLTICLLLMLAVCTVSICIGISEKINSKGEIQSIRRSTTADKELEIVANNKTGKEEKINIKISKKKFTEEEINELLEKESKQLQKVILGKNESLNHIDRPLNLPGSIGRQKVTVSWGISDSTLLGYDGKLSDKISKAGNIVNLTATLTFQKVSRDYIFSVNLFPESKDKTLQEKIQDKINGQNEYTEIINLPKSVEGEKVNYKYPVGNNDIKILVIGIIISCVIYFLKDNDLKKDVKSRNEQLMTDYPELVTSIMLYYEAGLSIKSVFEKIVSNYNERKKSDKEFRYVYEELEMSVNKMKSGISENIAIAEFGKRCGLHSYIKLTGLIEQNIKRGTKELTVALRNELKEALLEKKANMQKKGGQISTKLMGPMMIMLIIAIVIIMVPAFMSMGL